MWIFSSEKPGNEQAASDYKSMAKMVNDVNASPFDPILSVLEPMTKIKMKCLISTLTKQSFDYILLSFPQSHSCVFLREMTWWEDGRWGGLSQVWCPQKCLHMKHSKQFWSRSILSIMVVHRCVQSYLALNFEHNKIDNSILLLLWC